MNKSTKMNLIYKYIYLFCNNIDYKKYYYNNYIYFKMKSDFDKRQFKKELFGIKYINIRKTGCNKFKKCSYILIYINN